MRKFSWRATSLAAILAAGCLSPASSLAAVVVLDFEGINATYPSGFAFVQEFYNGGQSSAGTSGTNYGVSFGNNAQAICLNTPGVTCSNTSRGGLGDPNSQLGGLFFLAGSETFLNYSAGFDTGFSFFYSAINELGNIVVYDALNGTGNILATLVLPTTQSACGPSYNAGFCPFTPLGVAFAGIARSIGFGGVANQVVFDDITFGSVTPGVSPVPLPGAAILMGTALLGFAGFGARYRRQRRSVPGH